MDNMINKINAVEGFDPTPYAVDYTDLGTGETRKRLPVMAQIAWFRLKYPEGRISVQAAGCTPATKTRQTAFWQRLRPPGAIWRTNPPFRPENGRRRRRWVLP